MFDFHWREFSPPLSSAHRLLQCYHRQKRDRRRYNSRGIPPQPPATRAISQWGRSLEWRHAVTLHILVEKICISFFLFFCEGMLSLTRLSSSIMTLWVYRKLGQIKIIPRRWIIKLILLIMEVIVVNNKNVPIIIWSTFIKEIIEYKIIICNLLIIFIQL